MKWMGDKVPNFGPRVRYGKKYTPSVIVCHISAGTIGSMDNWFRNPAAEASSHFGVGRDGSIHQYVRLENAAWTQGLTADAIPNARAPIVKQMGVNPNLYCVSIEHEGYVEGHMDENGQVVVENFGLDGNLTEIQFWKSCWLHKYIQSEVERIWGHHIQFGPQYDLGHFQIDPKRKSSCPGKNFPWARLYAELAIAETMDLAAYEERIEYRISGAADFTHAYAAAARVQDLENKLGDNTWGPAAESKLLQLAPIMPQINYQGVLTGKGIAFRIAELYQTLSANSPYSAEALRKLLIVYNHMITTGLL
ncbi:N-acetylmuramoyl-L-alanine amidase [Cohnella sp. JJ-181]|uniref:N-acetylmuramoyl-L-alanine amidase n=1 Tax=Cohnella rhizoplanae TaxID=2974897 RepID=UPI00232CDE70|nr:N-acetylmuramoyl-L-alanine amidase [Cohnella sp. JJ-181]